LKQIPAIDKLGHPRHRFKP